MPLVKSIFFGIQICYDSCKRLIFAPSLVAFYNEGGVEDQIGLAE